MNPNHSIVPESCSMFDLFSRAKIMQSNGGKYKCVHSFTVLRLRQLGIGWVSGQMKLGVCDIVAHMAIPIFIFFIPFLPLIKASAENGSMCLLSRKAL